MKNKSSGGSGKNNKITHPVVNKLGVLTKETNTKVNNPTKIVIFFFVTERKKI